MLHSKKLPPPRAIRSLPEVFNALCDLRCAMLLLTPLLFTPRSGINKNCAPRWIQLRHSQPREWRVGLGACNLQTNVMCKHMLSQDCVLFVQIAGCGGGRGRVGPQGCAGAHPRRRPGAHIFMPRSPTRSLLGPGTCSVALQHYVVRAAWLWLDCSGAALPGQPQAALQSSAPRQQLFEATVFVNTSARPVVIWQVTVLEARDRLGGRVHTHCLTGTDGQTAAVDMGATFICGTGRDPPVNPMLTYAVDVLKLATRPKLRDGPHATALFDRQVLECTQWHVAENIRLIISVFSR